MGLVSDLVIILIAALAGGFLAQRLGQPLIVGYILAGVVVGPFTGGVTVENVHDIEQLAELGIVLLLFALGLELSFRELTPVRRVALMGGAMQLVLTAAVGFVLGQALGWGWRSSVWFGSLIALSSTMVALKTIQAQGRLGTLSSRVMLGILVVQDLAVVPLMIVLPELSDPDGDLMRVALAALQAFALLGVIVFAATRVVPRLMSFVARGNSRELFFLATTALAVGVGYLTFMAGLSMALGAFLAGLVVNESEYAHQALSDVIPLRDLFGMVFFVSVGMLLDPLVAWRQLGILALLVVTIAASKAAILGIIVRLFGYWNVVPVAVALTLFQVGEFAFVLARVGLSSGAISQDVYTLTLNVAIATMALTPFVSGLTPAIYARFWRRRDREALSTANVPEAGLAEHVVIAGAGRVGRGIAHALTHLNLPFALIEFDDRRMRQAKDARLPIIYGDATQPVVLEAAKIASARALLITVPSFPDVRSIVMAARHARPDLPIIARADGPDAVQALYDLGIQEVTSPEFEAAIEMTRQALMNFRVPAQDILRVASVIRHQQYAQTSDRGSSGQAVMLQIGDMARELEFVWVGLPPDGPFIGHSIEELRIRSRTGVSVVGVIHDGSLNPNPDGTARFEAGDLVAVLGTRDQIARFEQAMR